MYGKRRCKLVYLKLQKRSEYRNNGGPSINRDNLKMLRVNETVERGGTFVFTRDLSYTASISFTRVRTLEFTLGAGGFFFMLFAVKIKRRSCDPDER